MAISKSKIFAYIDYVMLIRLPSLFLDRVVLRKHWLSTRLTDLCDRYSAEFSVIKVR